MSPHISNGGVLRGTAHHPNIKISSVDMVEFVLSLLLDRPFQVVDRCAAGNHNIKDTFDVVSEDRTVDEQH